MHYKGPSKGVLLQGSPLRDPLRRFLKGPFKLEGSFFFFRGVGSWVSCYMLQGCIPQTNGWLSKLWPLFGYPK